MLNKTRIISPHPCRWIARASALCALSLLCHCGGHVASDGGMTDVGGPDGSDAFVNDALGATDTTNDSVPSVDGGGHGDASSPDAELTCASPTAAFDPAPIHYTLPAARCATSFDAFAKLRPTAPISYVLMDLTGDQRADLVVYSDMCDATVGVDHWDLYAGGDTGFALAPVHYGLPTRRCNTSWDTLAKNRPTSPLTYSLLDLTNDGIADLVVFADQCDATVGASHWDLYAGGATAFGATSTAYALPTARCASTFDAPAKVTANGIGYALLDRVGDRRPDLVVYTDHCDTTVGVTHWDAYTAGASGFAAASIPYGLPTRRCATDWNALSKLRPAAAISYTLLDVSGDGQSDLLVNADMCDATVGQTHWDAYPAGADSFGSTPIHYGVPTARCATDWTSLARLRPTDHISAGLLGLSCGLFPTMAVYSDMCDATTGQTHWDLYVGNAAGLNAAPLAATLPAGRCQVTFDSPARTHPPDHIGYQLLNLAGDARPDITVNVDTCDTTVGMTHWDVYPLR